MEMNLSGQWGLALDTSYPESFDDSILLPSTTEISCKGEWSLDGSELRYLSRVRPYTGSAFYKKEVAIPEEWQGKRIFLYMERTKLTRVFVDGLLTGSSGETIIPQSYDLTRALTPGKHTLVVEVNNDLKKDPHFPDELISGHQYTDHTQTNWNGILGKILLKALPPVHMIQGMVTGDPEKKLFHIRLTLENTGPACQQRLAINAQPKGAGKIYCPDTQQETLSLPTGISEHTLVLPVLKPCLWDEFNPVYYMLSLHLEEQTLSLRGFFRTVAKEGRCLKVNGLPVSLRGTVDCAIFPLTGACPTTVSAWLALLEQMKSYGLNHYRFHSWCPPEAAFEAADRLGMYLQVELPCFGTRFYPEGHPRHNSVLNSFLYDQSIKLLKEFGNHPSFFIFAVGNEMTGDPACFKDLISLCRSLRADKVYTQGANNFLGDPLCIPSDDCWIMMRTDKSHNIRGSFAHADLPLGHIQTGDTPSASADYTEALELSPIPLIAHETGQFQIFPRLDERDDYTGPLYPTVLNRLEKELQQKGLTPLAEAFFEASGRLALQCYREDIEALLRTPGMTGFQMLGLQDFPGQGTALVGILDSFFRSKGLVSQEEWRRFCAPQVLLAKLPRYTYAEGDTLELEVLLYNFGAQPVEGELLLTLHSENTLLYSCTADSVTAPRGALTKGASFSFAVPPVTEPCEARLTLTLGHLQTAYDLWLYPSAELASDREVLVAWFYSEEVVQALQEGRTVVLFTASASEQYSLPGFFATDFWCYPMFLEGTQKKGLPPAPGTMGLLIDSLHPALDAFPTREYAQWQWHGLCFNARPILLDRFSEKLRPIVRVIDNFSRNNSLGLLFEVSAGPGRLIVSASEVKSRLHKPEVRQYYNSLLRYAAQCREEPDQSLSFEELRAMFLD